MKTKPKATKKKPMRKVDRVEVANAFEELRDVVEHAIELANRIHDEISQVKRGKGGGTIVALPRFENCLDALFESNVLRLNEDVLPGYDDVVDPDWNCAVDDLEGFADDMGMDNAKDGEAGSEE